MSSYVNEHAHYYSRFRYSRKNSSNKVHYPIRDDNRLKANPFSTQKINLK